MPLPSGPQSFCWKICHNHMEIPLYVCWFSLLLLIVSFFFNFCQFDYYVSLCVSPWVNPVWISLCFLDLIDCFLYHVRDFFSYYLFKCFSRTLLLSLLLLGPLWFKYCCVLRCPRGILNCLCFKVDFKTKSIIKDKEGFHIIMRINLKRRYDL